MPKRSVWRVLKLILIAVALVTTAMALYIQLFERTPQDQIFVESPAGLEAGIPEEPEKADPPAQDSAQPLPGAVLRRSESARDRALQQALSPESAEAAAIARLEQRVEAMARQADRTDRVMRQDLEQIRAEARRDRNAARKVLGLLIAALTSLGLLAVVVLVEERAARSSGGSVRI